MNKRSAVLALAMAFSLLPWGTASAGQPGMTDAVFNKRFLSIVKPMMAYEQLAKDIGTPGKMTQEEKSSSGPIATYHWDGGRKSSLDVKTIGGSVIGAVVVTPRQHRLTMDRNGRITEDGE